MDVWNILGINPTNDLSIIKKAYAAKLKIYHPEDDPEGYQRLREAYDLVIKLSKNSDSEKVRISNNSDTNKSEWSDNSSTILNTFNDIYRTNIQTSSENEINFDQLNADFVNQANSLYLDFTSRIDINKWNSLFDSDVIWNMNNREEINCLMLEFVFEHSYFPQDIWKLFNSTFNWKDQEDLWDSQYADIYNHICKQLDRSKPLSYSFIKCKNPIDYDKYLSYREKAYDAFLDKKYKATLINAKKASDIYESDSELQYLQARLFYNLRNYRKALIFLNRALEIDPSNIDYYIIRSKVNSKLGLISNAVGDLEAAIKINPDRKELYTLVARCYYREKDYENARKFIKKAIEYNNKDYSLKVLLYRAENRLLKKLKKGISRNPKDYELIKKYEDVKDEIGDETKYIKRKTPFNTLLITLFLPVTICLFLLYYAIDNSAKNMSKPSGNTITELASKVRNNFLFGKDIRVQGTVSNILMLPLKSTIKKYSEEDEAEVSPLYDYEINDTASGFEGYIYTGKIANKEYIIAAAPKNFFNGKSNNSLIKNTGSIKRILSSNAITFKGTLKYIDSSNILKSVKSALNSNGISIDNLVTDEYIVLDKPIKKNKTWEFILFCFVYPLAAFSIVVTLVLWDWYRKYSFKDVA